MGEPPLHPAILIGIDETPAGPLALVQHGRARLVVTLDTELAMEIAPGDEVLLGPDRTTVVRRSPFAVARCGETAIFERSLPDGRMVLRRRDEAVLVEAAASLQPASLEAGDLVRWSESAALALERVPPSTASPFFLEDAPAETFADIGGMDHVIEELRASIGMHGSRPLPCGSGGCGARGRCCWSVPPATARPCWRGRWRTGSGRSPPRGAHDS